MKKLVVLILTLAMVFSATAVMAETKTVTLGEDVIVNTTPFGNVPVNKQYKLFAGMVVTIEGEYDGWTVIHYSDEFGTLFIETGEHKLTGSAAQIPTAPGKVPITDENITRGVVGEGWQVWARFEPKSVFEEGEEKGDKILHAGDVVEINGDIVEDAQGNEYYPIRMKKGDIYVQRYVTAKYIDIPIK